MRGDRLLHLYPPRWRNRYGDEFLATLADRQLTLQDRIDIVSGAIDAWLSADVRHATLTPEQMEHGGASMTVKMLCSSNTTRYTTRDAFVGAVVLIALSLIGTGTSVFLRRSGWVMPGEILAGITFPIAMMLSMPFWLMKGQPWKAQTAIVGSTVTLLVVLGYLGARF